MDFKRSKKAIILLCIVTLYCLPIFSMEQSDINELYDKVETAYYQWNEDELNSLLLLLTNEENKGFDELFLITKTYFRLAFLDFEKNQGNYTNQFRSDNETKKGYMNYCVYYGEKAFKLDQNNTELNYYLDRGFQSLISSVDTYFQYKEKMDKYRNQNLKIDPDGFYTLLFETYFHSIYSEAAGADRKKGEVLQNKIKEKYPENPETFNLLSDIAFNKYDYEDAEKYCLITLSIDKYHYAAKQRLDFLLFLKEKPIINEIIIKDNGGIDEKIIFKFINVKKGIILTADIIKSIRDDLEAFSSISGVNIYFDKIENNRVNLGLSISTETDKIVSVGGGYEFVFNYDRMDQYQQYLQGVSPVILYYSHPNLFKKGLFELNILSIFGMGWDISLNFNLLEYMQINFGLDSWIVPIGNVFTDYSAGKKDKAELVYLNTSPYLEIGKKFDDNKIEAFFRYKSNFIFMMPDDYPLNEAEKKAGFIYPPDFFVEHDLGITFQANYISLLEGGMVRKGFKMKCEADWFKKTSDTEWGYKNYLNKPSFASFLFHVYFEYSDYIKDIFYYSLGFHYKGGINLYKNQMISIENGVIGVPFDAMMKIHGLNFNCFKAEHVLLLNSLYGFKVNKIFHIGFYLDICTFFERESDTFLAKIPDSSYYNNLIFGYGTFIKWNPYKLFVITLETSFSHEIGQNVIRGPIIGFHIQKSFVVISKRKIL